MTDFEKDEVPKLSDTHPKLSNEPVDSRLQRLVPSTRSVSISIPINSMEPYEGETNLVRHTGPLQSERETPFNQLSDPLYVSHRSGNLFQQNILVPGNQAVVTKTENFPSFHGMDDNDLQNNYGGKNENLQRAGPLGMCNDPHCSTCPAYFKATQQRNSKASGIFHPKLHNALYGDAKGWARRLCVSLIEYIPGVMNPHAEVVQQWNKFFVICCVVGIFVDPLFFFLPSVQKEQKCIVTNWTMVAMYVLLRSMIDFIYFLNILLQFRLAYVAPESRVVGARELVDNPKKIALHYLQTYFIIDLVVVLPLPQIILLFVLPEYLGSSEANVLLSQKLSHVVVLFQYSPRLFRILPMLIYPPGFRIESEWANIFINLLIFMLSSHVIGSCWYIFGLQRVNQCLQYACKITRIEDCTRYIDCGHGISEQYNSNTNWVRWKNNTYANACFTEDGFAYGIYLKAVNLTADHNMIARYVYSLFWGFQQISTLAGNLNPSYFVLEVLFTMTIIGLGLFVFALLIGNIQNFLQALGRRRLEMSVRRRDVDQWMNDQRFSEDLKRRVRQAERFSWAATRGVNEELLLENLPEDLQRDIRRHKFKFVKKVRIFALMDEPILDAICERLKPKTYIKGSKILYDGGPVEKMVFVVHGKLESIGEDGIRVPLYEGHACGKELLTWCLEHYSMNKDDGKVRTLRQRLLSNRTVRCLTNVKACSLRAADLEEVISLFATFFQNPRVHAAIRLSYSGMNHLTGDALQQRASRLYGDIGRNVLVMLTLHNQMKYQGFRSRCNVLVI